MTPPGVARATSMLLVSGVVAAVYFSQGLHVWAGLIAWASFLDAGGTGPALKRTIAGNSLGVCVGWVAEIVVFSIPVDPATWHWIPRSAGAIALSLPVLLLATRFALFSHLPALLYGFAAVFGAILIPYGDLTGPQRLAAVHLYNPLFLLVISMVGGAVAGLAAERLTPALQGSRGRPAAPTD